MFRLRKPDEQYLARVREGCRDLPLSYTEVGCTRAGAPIGYAVDNYRVRLSSGPIVFEKAREALRNWHVLRLGWVQPCWPDAPVKEGALVGTLTRLLGLWAVNVCRVVYVLDEDGPIVRFGFAYGTLPGHAECGEERFQVEWLRADDSVWYDILAISKPGGWLTRLGYPLARRLQLRFGRDSLRTFSDAVRNMETGTPPCLCGKALE
jgi:uncharacterized protein (UPF0548 family)